MSYWFHPGAEREHFENIVFYESRQPGLGGAYLAEFENLMIRVADMPERFRVERKPNIRVVSLTDSLIKSFSETRRVAYRF